MRRLDTLVQFQAHVPTCLSSLCLINSQYPLLARYYHITDVFSTTSKYQPISLSDCNPGPHKINPFDESDNNYRYDSQ